MTLQSVLARFAASYIDGVPGVILIDSRCPGPVVGIGACTHGHETGGLAALGSLLKDDWLARNIRCGAVLLTVHNLAAAERALRAATVEEKRRCAFVDCNMNRLPCDLLKGEGDGRYEIVRSRELAPILARCDAGLDIHSTTQESQPMVLEMKDEAARYTTCMPASIVLSDIARVQIGMPLCMLFGGMDRPVPVLEVEAGSHEHPETASRAAQMARAFLRRAGVLEPRPFPRHNQRRYCVVDALRFPDDSYALECPLPMFAPVRKGEVLARGNGAPLLCPVDGQVIFAPRGVRPTSVAEEVCFFVQAS